MPYSIIGADDREYGPVDTTTLISWASEGRVVERTQLRDHETGRRFLACDMAELSPIFKKPPVEVVQRMDQPIVPSYTSYPPAPSFGSHPPGPYYSAVSHRSRLVAGILGILFGFVGVHRFYLGYTSIGVIQLLMGTVLAIFTCGLSLLVSAIWGSIEGIICLTGGMPDAEGRILAP